MDNADGLLFLFKWMTKDNKWLSRFRTIIHSPLSIFNSADYLRQMNFIIKVIISTLAVLLTSYLLPKHMVAVDGVSTAIIVALVLAFLNAIVKPIMILLTL